jgi:hypothetical protein
MHTFSGLKDYWKINMNSTSPIQVPNHHILQGFFTKNYELVFGEG